MHGILEQMGRQIGRQARMAGVVLWALCLTAAGCGSIPKESQVRVRDLPSQLNPGAPLALDVSNRLGAVRVMVEPELRAPIIHAEWIEPTSLNAPASRSYEPEVRAIRIPRWVWAQYVDNEGRATLRVVNSDLDEHDANRRVLLTIRVPRCDGVRVRNSGGPVDLVGVGGAVHVDNGFGRKDGARVSLRTNQDIVDPVILSTSDGDIEYAVGPGSAGRIEVDCARSDLRVSDPAGLINRISDSARDWVGVLNQGTAPVSLYTGKGVVTISLPQPAPRAPDTTANATAP